MGGLWNVFVKSFSVYWNLEADVGGTCLLGYVDNFFSVTVVI